MDPKTTGFATISPQGICQSEHMAPVSGQIPNSTIACSDVPSITLHTTSSVRPSLLLSSHATIGIAIGTAILFILFMAAVFFVMFRRKRTISRLNREEIRELQEGIARNKHDPSVGVDIKGKGKAEDVAGEDLADRDGLDVGKRSESGTVNNMSSAEVLARSPMAILP